MDQSRLEELRKLLNNQHSDAKQNLTEGLYPKNFNAFDFKNLKLEDASSKTLNSDDTAINKSSEVQARDYDKDPIILKNYEYIYIYIYIYQKLLMVFSLFISGVFAIIVNFDWKASGAANYSANDGICMILFLSFLSLFIILPELIDYKKERPMIQLKNNQIEFYEKDKIAYVEQCENLQHNMDWSFFIGNFKGKRGLLYIFMAVLLCLVFMTIDLVVARWFLSFALFQFAGNILVKFIFCLVLGKSGDRRFSLFPTLRVGEPHYGHIGLFACSRYYLIPIFRNSIYFELKEYFLTRHNININDVDKIYC